MSRVIGVDARGRPGFWTTTIVDGRIEAIETVDELDAVLEPKREVDVVAIDIPLGHEDPQGGGTGKRACDVAACSLLGAAEDRLFWMPPHAVLHVEHYHEALAMCEANDWPKLEAPLWHARDRLRRVRHAASVETRLVEVHPEASFTLLRNEQGTQGPMEHYGETWAALEERLTALHEAGLHPEGIVDGKAPGSILDATVAAWTARRVAGDDAVSLPDAPPVDPETRREVAIRA